MLNKKGLTILELLVSIALISVVMIFLFNLLTDLMYSDDYASFAKRNQTNRAAIITAIEKDFISKELTDVKYGNNKITFYYYDGSTCDLYVTKSGSTNAIKEGDTLNYKCDTLQKWKAVSTEGNVFYSLKNFNESDVVKHEYTAVRTNIDTNGDGVPDTNIDKDGDGVVDSGNANNTYTIKSNFYYYKITIPVVVKKSLKDNTYMDDNSLDDITLFYLHK